MVLDGGVPGYFNVASLPHFDALAAQGTQYSNALDGILEAETPAGHATIATGSRPNRDGILGFDWGLSDNSRFSLFSPDKMAQLEQLLTDSGAPTIGGLYKARYPQAKVVALSGHKYYAAAPLGGPQADAIMYYQGDAQGRYVPVAVPGHVPPPGVLDAPGVISPTTREPTGAEDDLVTSLALAAVNKMHPRILLMNYPEFDWPIGHVDGGPLDKSVIQTAMLDWDNDLGRIEDAYQRAGILNQTLFVITADHGMMPITRFVPSAGINNAISQAGTSASDIASNSGDYIWLDDPAKAQIVAQRINALNDPGIQSVYYLSTVGGTPHYVSASSSSLSGGIEAANQYLLGALLNGHEPTLVVFGQEGASFSNPSSGWKADHGGGSWESQHIPLILAGPGIRSGAVISQPAELEDVAPTVLADMGVPPTGMRGRVLSDALLHPSTQQQQARAAEVNLLTPLAGALSSASQQIADAG